MLCQENMQSFAGLLNKKMSEILKILYIKYHIIIFLRVNKNLIRYYDLGGQKIKCT